MEPQPARSRVEHLDSVPAGSWSLPAFLLQNGQSRKEQYRREQRRILGLNWEAWPEARVRQESFGDAAGFQIGPVGPILEVLGEVSVNKGSGRFRERFLALQVGFEQITLHLTGNRQSAYR